MSFKKFSTHQDNNKLDTAHAERPADVQTVLQPVIEPGPAPVAMSAPSKP